MIELSDILLKKLSVSHLAIAEGRTAVIGPNGSGKTTLLEVCSGLILPEQGSVTVGALPPRECEVGWVGEFPDQNLVFERVFDEIASALRFRHLPCETIRERVWETARTIGISHLLDSSTDQLSGGEKALVALAAAIITRPDLLVLDEVDSHLDGRTGKRIQRLSGDLGIPYIIQCTQDMQTAASLDFVIYIEDGRVMLKGTPDEVFPALRETCFYPPLWRLSECR